MKLTDTGFKKALATAMNDLNQYINMQRHSGHPEWYVEEIEEKHGRVNELHRLWRKFKGVPVAQGMGEIVDSVVERYHADFYYHDLSYMETHVGELFGWLVGDCGTHLMPLVAHSESEQQACNDNIDALKHSSYANYALYMVDPIAGTMMSTEFDQLYVQLLAEAV